MKVKSSRLMSCFSAILAIIFCGGTLWALAVSAETTTLVATSGGGTVTTVESGSVVTLTATVKAGAVAVTRGQVNFCDAAATYCTGTHLLGSGALPQGGPKALMGTAAIQIVPGIGTHSYKAIFIGTTGYVTSISSEVTLTVTAAAPAITTIPQSGSAQTSTPDEPLTEAQIANLKLPVVIDERSNWCIPAARIPVPEDEVGNYCKIFLNYELYGTSRCQQKLEFACTCYKTVAPVYNGGYPIVGCSEVLVVDGHAQIDARRLANENEVRQATQPHVTPWTGNEAQAGETGKRYGALIPLKRRPISVSCRKDGVSTGLHKEVGQDDSHCKYPVGLPWN